MQKPTISSLVDVAVSIKSTGFRKDAFDPNGFFEDVKDTGSGFYVRAPSGNLYILTNNHVVSNSVNIFVDNEPTSHAVLYKNKGLDIAILEGTKGLIAVA